MEKSRRTFIKQATLAGAGVLLAKTSWSAKSYKRIIGANDRVRVGVVGFSDRHKSSHIPSFMNHYKELNFEVVAVSDIWNKRREEGAAVWKGKMNNDVKAFRNNEELYDSKMVDAVFISTADFQHARHAIEAVKAGCDVYCEKPFAETMEDNREALKVIKASDRIVQIGSQRRSGTNYHAANDFIRSGKFGDIKMVELTWNVNVQGKETQHGRVDVLQRLKNQQLWGLSLALDRVRETTANFQGFCHADSRFLLKIDLVLDKIGVLQERLERSQQVSHKQHVLSSSRLPILAAIKSR